MIPSFEFVAESILRLRTRSDATTDDSLYAKHHHPDAKIWSLLWMETEAEDMELVEVLKAIPDVLLFVSSSFHLMKNRNSKLCQAGLFASPFIIERRKGLREDPQETLIIRRDIVSIFRNDSSVSPPFYPSTSLLCRPR